MYCLKRACRWIFCEKLINLLHDYEAGHNIHSMYYISGILYRGHFLGIRIWHGKFTAIKISIAEDSILGFTQPREKGKHTFERTLLSAGLRWFTLVCASLSCLVYPSIVLSY